MLLTYIILLALLDNIAALFAGFSTGFQLSNFVATRCEGYVGHQLCGGYDPNNGAASSTIHYMAFQPNTTLNAFITSGINEQLTADGFVSSYSTPRYFISHSPTGGVYQIDPTTSSATLLHTLNYSSYTSIFIRAQKSPTPKFYFFLISNTSTSAYTTLICYKILPSPVCTPLLTLPTQVVAASVSEFGYLVVLHVDNVINKAVLSVVGGNGTILWNGTQRAKGTKYFLDTSFHFSAYAINGFGYVVNTNTSTEAWTFSVAPPRNFKSISLLYPWLLLYDELNKIRQYNVEVGPTLFDSHSPLSNSYSYLLMTFNYTSQQYKAYLYYINDTLTYESFMSDQYPCAAFTCAAFTCAAGYAATGGSTCLASVARTMIPLMAVPVVTPPIPPPVPPATPTNTSTNTSTNTTTTTTTTTTTNTTVIIPIITPPAPILLPPSPTNSTSLLPLLFQLCLTPITPNASQCLLFCSQTCNQCSQTRLNCHDCSQYYFMASEVDGLCEMEPPVKLVVIFYAIANAFKHSSTLSFYAYLHNFDLYQYHRVRYRGVLEAVFNFTRFLAEKEWELVLMTPVENKFDTFWFVNSEYIPYTNRDYLLVQRKDLTFLQNTKQFFFLFIPIIVLTFALLNRLFNQLAKYPIGRIFRNFSFWLYLPGILVFNDTSRFSYLAFLQISNLSHFRFSSVVLQAISIVVIGVWVVLCFSMYLMYRYFYRRRSIDLMGNLHYKLDSILAIIFRFTVKPFIQGIVHCLLWTNLQLQILSLLSIELVFFFLFCYCQITQKLVKAKLIFLLDCTLDLLAALINVLIYLKFVEILRSNQEGRFEGFQEQFQVLAHDLMEFCILVAVYLSGVVLAVSFILGVTELITSFVRKQEKSTTYRRPKKQSLKNRKKQQKISNRKIKTQKKRRQDTKQNAAVTKSKVIRVNKVQFRKEVQQFLNKGKSRVFQ